MESVEWIFTDHKLHLSVLQLLKDEQAFLSNDTPDASYQDEEISGMVALYEIRERFRTV